MDFRGLAEAPDGLDHDHHGDDDEDQGVGQGSQYLGPLVSIGPLVARRTGGDPRRHEGDEDSSGVGEHVAGISQQGQRARHDGANHLDAHHA